MSCRYLLQLRGDMLGQHLNLLVDTNMTSSPLSASTNEPLLQYNNWKGHILIVKKRAYDDFQNLPYHLTFSGGPWSHQPVANQAQIAGLNNAVAPRLDSESLAPTLRINGSFTPEITTRLLNLFHAVVESVSKKPIPWEADLEEERRARENAVRAAIQKERQHSANPERVREMKRELQIPKEEVRRAWEELGRRALCRAPGSSREQRGYAQIEIQYANNVTSPMFSGRWDLRGKIFWVTNSRSLGILLVEGGCSKAAAVAFGQTFKQTYTGHGGKVMKDAVLIDSAARNPNVAEAVTKAYAQIKTQTKATPQLLFCVLRFNNTGTYERIKKSGDCRFGLLTQCVLARHVEKNQGQYHSNVAIKVNAKLRGITCRIPYPSGPAGKASAFFKEVTMVIGVDVSHATPSINASSMAVMTMSMDQNATFYSAAIETNGYRVGMLSPINAKNFIARLMLTWHKRMIQPPTPHVDLIQAQHPRCRSNIYTRAPVYDFEFLSHKSPGYAIVVVI
ncbi:piwi domain-containing protein [Colletotrichum incanum]|uniref:Piwi domain-containing protein n=1 Tax=Colletotrichum incanum TaxID=1573173 RepID=A0A167ABJ8_COLIC|nr:piwi domain-containing protein [Colletotrichum incanum]